MSNFASDVTLRRDRDDGGTFKSSGNVSDTSLHQHVLKHSS